MKKIDERGQNVKVYLQEMVLSIIAAPVDSMSLLFRLFACNYI